MRRLQRALTVAVLVAAALGTLLLVTHTVTLVTTHGVSMLPGFQSGDLAFLVPSGSYHVGEVVGYQSPLLHVTVLHRIVADHNGLFTFKGDSNHFLDPVQLGSSAIVGRLALRIPHGGIVLGWVRSPVGLAVLGVLLVMSGSALLSGRRRRLRRRSAGTHYQTRDQPTRNQSPPIRSPRTQSPATPASRRRSPASHRDVPDPWWMVLTSLGLLLIATFVVVGAFGLPAVRPGHRPVTYRQTVTFGYSADTPAGVTYPAGRVITGDPVFLALVHQLDMSASFDLSVPAGESLSLHGTMEADVYFEGPSGWMAEVASSRAVPFSGIASTVDIPVAVDQLSALGAAFTKETGIPVGDANLVIQPKVTIAGRIDGQAFGDSFAPSLLLQDSGGSLTLVGSTGSTGSPTYPQLTAEQNGSVAQPVEMSVSTSLLGHRMTVSTERYLGVALLVLALVGMATAAFTIRHRRKMGETEHIRAAYRDNLIPIATSPESGQRAAVEVASIGLLSRLAIKYECVILELVHDLGTSYYVDVGPSLYRYGVRPGSGPQGGTEDRSDSDVSARLQIVRPAS